MSEAHPPIALLRNVSVQKIVKALEQDGFSFTARKGSQRIYSDMKRRVIIHYHSGSDTLPPYVIRNLLLGTTWQKSDLLRLKLIKEH